MRGKSGITGTIVGLAGAGLFGWALFSALTSAECLAAAAAGEEGCNPPYWIAFAMMGGILIFMIGMARGNKGLLLSSLFLAIGLSALVPTMLGMMPDMQLFGYAFGGIFVFFGLLPLFGGRLGAAKEKQAMALMESGARGIGTIVEISDTGATINENPQMVVRMRIEPVDGSPAIERDKTIVASRLKIPRVGDRYPVWFDRADPDKWMFATEMRPGAPAEARELFERARTGAGPAPAESGPVEELVRLTGLWKDGALTDAEFADAKARLLPRIGG